MDTSTVKPQSPTNTTLPALNQLTTLEYPLDDDSFEIFDWTLSNWTNASSGWWNYGDVTSEAGWAGEREGEEEGELWREIPLGMVLTFLCLLTTVGNIMVLQAVRTEKRLQSVSTNDLGFDPLLLLCVCVCVCVCVCAVSYTHLRAHET